MTRPVYRSRLAGLALCVSAALPIGAQADEALVAVAANFSETMDAMSAAFTMESGHTLQVTTGATGKLYAQIAQGAPFAVLLSADSETPARLEMEDLAVVGSVFTYAIGNLSLWSPDEDRIRVDPIAALTASDTLFIAIANPDLAPYGFAAREAMQAMDVWDAVRDKIVMGQNIGQTFSMVDTGAAQVGFIATSAIQSPSTKVRGSFHQIPQHMFSPIKQDAVLLDAGRDNAAAIAFMAFLKTDTAKSITRSFGYGVE